MARFRGRLFLVLASVLGMALSFAAAAAQTPVPMTTSDILEGGQTLIGQYGLLALVLVGAFIGVAALLIRRLRRSAG